MDQGQAEVIFVDGGSSDSTENIIRENMEQYPFIRLLKNPEKYTPISMNLGIKASDGEYIFILSAHAKYEDQFFTKLVEAIEILDADCVGPLLVTDVKNKNNKSDAIKDVLTHKFGVGDAYFRTGSKEIKEVDTVAFGCYKKSTFETYGLFDERLIRNQDIEFNKRIVNGGGKIYVIPDVSATYYARENFLDLAKNSYANGFWNILTAYYTKRVRSLSLRHFIPLLFLLSWLLPLLFSLCCSKLLWISIFSLVSYLSFVIIISIKMKNGTNTIPYLVMSFLTLHVSYGWGSLMGIFSSIMTYIKGKK